MDKRVDEQLRHVYNQLPRDIQDKFKIDVKADAFLIRASASFTGPDGRVWETPLENQPAPTDARTSDASSWEICTKVPEVFLAQLCLVV